MSRGPIVNGVIAGQTLLQRDGRESIDQKEPQAKITLFNIF